MNMNTKNDPFWPKAIIFVKENNNPTPEGLALI
jgi:hypothetical protein